MHEIAAILLTAGRSERMGAFKPLLPFGNRTVVEACIEYLHQSGIRKIVVVVGHRGDEIRERLGTSSVMFAVNPDPTSEMNISIACGIQEIPVSAHAILVALVDHPAVSADVVEALKAEWEKGARLVVPTWQGRGGHPVLIDRCLRSELLSLNPARGLKALFEAHRDEVKRVPVNSPYIARDIDTWDDYSSLYRDVFNATPPELASVNVAEQGSDL